MCVCVCVCVCACARVCMYKTGILLVTIISRLIGVGSLYIAL